MRLRRPGAARVGVAVVPAAAHVPVALVLVLGLATGCATTAPPAPVRWETISTTGAAITADVPRGWGAAYEVTVTDPAGTSIRLGAADVELAWIYASATALGELAGPAYADESLLPTRHLITALRRLVGSARTVDGCVFDSTRPVQVGGFYGFVDRWHDCPAAAGDPDRARLVALRDDRAVTVVVDVRTRSDSPDRLAGAILGRLRVDADRLPRRVDAVTVTPLG
jgi:hypothetical protein